MRAGEGAEGAEGAFMLDCQTDSPAGQARQESWTRNQTIVLQNRAEFETVSDLVPLSVRGKKGQSVGAA